MQLYNWKDFKNGWICGDFIPTLFPLETAEIAIKRYKKGSKEPSHYHKQADEVTMIISGTVKMNEIIYKKNDIVLIEKGEMTDFMAITAAVTCVIKIPCVRGDKYLS